MKPAPLCSFKRTWAVTNSKRLTLPLPFQTGRISDYPHRIGGRSFVFESYTPAGERNVNMVHLRGEMVLTEHLYLLHKNW